MKYLEYNVFITYDISTELLILKKKTQNPPEVDLSRHMGVCGLHWVASYWKTQVLSSFFCSHRCFRPLCPTYLDVCLYSPLIWLKNRHSLMLLLVSFGYTNSLIVF